MVRGKANSYHRSQTESEKSSISKMPSANVQKGSGSYMKSTSSSDSRKRRSQVILHSSIAADKKASQKNLKILDMFNYSQSLTRNSRLQLMRSSTKNGNSDRATCSSTVKNKKFAEASVVKVCPYSYCQLHGHKHDPVPSLNCFLSSRRRLLKTQKSMKPKELSPLRMANVGTIVLNNLDVAPNNQLHKDFFVNIHAEPKARGERAQNHHEREELPKVIFQKGDNDATRMQESFTTEIVKNIHDYVNFDQKVKTGGKDGQRHSLTVAGIQAHSEKDYQRDEDGQYLNSRNENTENCADGQVDTSTKERSIRSLQFEEENKITDTVRNISHFAEDCIKENESYKQKSWFIAEEIKKFNLRPPQILLIKPDPQAETVDLRHQMMDERKAAKEWMIDYGLRKVVKRLASSRKRKVELLVEAFETVILFPVFENSMHDTEGETLHA